MSLMERVKAAGMEDDIACDPSYSDELKQRVGKMIEPRHLAKLASENPLQAQGEIRSAVDAILQESPWLGEGAESPEAITQSLVNAMFGLGPLEPYLADESVTEIMVNGTHSLFVERNGACVSCPVPFASDDDVRTLIDRILGPLGRRVDESTPMADARLSSGHRVNAVIPPISPDGPMLTIRKFSSRVLKMSDLQALGTIDDCTRQLLSWAVAARKNVAVSGGTGTGKTTMLNALSCEIDFAERVLTIEDSAELRFLEHPHVVRMEARPLNAEGKGEVTIRDLVKNALRMRPDRIVVGEVRGGEALDMLTAMNTGHDGSMTTLHSNSPQDAITRLSTMVRFAADLPLDAIEAQLGGAIDLIVQISRYRDGTRRISEICEVSFDREKCRCEVGSLFVRDGGGVGTWCACPSWIDGLAADGIADEGEVERWMDAACLRPCAA
ncbi:MAG: CpaF family protein [Eggerthellaceae bacterium]|nr:CpaF family protein [Eggerthellaceae bacterium]